MSNAQYETYETYEPPYEPQYGSPSYEEWRPASYPVGSEGSVGPVGSEGSVEPVGSVGPVGPVGFVGSESVGEPFPRQAGAPEGGRADVRRAARR
ncbi:hypothetical protein ABZ831_22675, partial [Streptomyces sp. NPDC047123]